MRARSVRTKALAWRPIAGPDGGQIEPPLPVQCPIPCSSPTHHQPREGPQKLLRPRARRPAHPQQPPHPDEPAERGDEGPHLKEGGGAVYGPVGTCASGGRHCVCRGFVSGGRPIRKGLVGTRGKNSRVVAFSFAIISCGYQTRTALAEGRNNLKNRARHTRSRHQASTSSPALTGAYNATAYK